jgi:hypothetical protein
MPPFSTEIRGGGKAKYLPLHLNFWRKLKTEKESEIYQILKLFFKYDTVYVSILRCRSRRKAIHLPSPQNIWNPPKLETQGQTYRIDLLIPKYRKFWEWLLPAFLSYDASNNYSIVACVFVAVVTFLPNRCIATIGVHINTRRLMGGIYGVRRSDWLSCHGIHAKFHKDWLRHSEIDTGGHTDTQTARWSPKPTLFFFQNKESTLKWFY